MPQQHNLLLQLHQHHRRSLASLLFVLHARPIHVEVEVAEDEDPEAAFRRFQSEVNKIRLPQLYRAAQHFERPRDKKFRKKMERIKFFQYLKDRGDSQVRSMTIDQLEDEHKANLEMQEAKLIEKLEEEINERKRTQKEREKWEASLTRRDEDDANGDYDDDSDSDDINDDDDDDGENDDLDDTGDDDDTQRNQLSNEEWDAREGEELQSEDVEETNEGEEADYEEEADEEMESEELDEGDDDFELEDTEEEVESDYEEEADEELESDYEQESENDDGEDVTLEGWDDEDLPKYDYSKHYGKKTYDPESFDYSGLFEPGFLDDDSTVE